MPKREYQGFTIKQTFDGTFHVGGARFYSLKEAKDWVDKMNIAGERKEMEQKSKRRKNIPARVVSVEGRKGKSKWSRLRNASKPDLSDAERMSERFHGREPREVFEIEETESFDETVAVLGDLVELNVLCSDGKNEICISFEKDRPKLACDSQGGNLLILGGDQKLEVDEGNTKLPFERHKGKKLLPLGLCRSVAYETDKHHLEDSNGEMVTYEHQFGEEGGSKPVIVYNVTDAKLMFVGGSYTIEDEGIKD